MQPFPIRRSRLTVMLSILLATMGFGLFAVTQSAEARVQGCKPGKGMVCQAPLNRLDVENSIQEDVVVQIDSDQGIHVEPGTTRDAVAHRASYDRVRITVFRRSDGVQLFTDQYTFPLRNLTFRATFTFYRPGSGDGYAGRLF